MAQEVARANRTYSRPSIPSRDLVDLVDWCMSASERDGHGKLYLRNVPGEKDRRLLSERVHVLMASLKDHDQREIAIMIGDMLAAYDVAQAKQITAAERKAAIVVYVRELHGVPTWAIAEACNRIRFGTAPDISHQYKPTPIQVRVLAVSIAQPWKQQVMLIGEILTAQTYHEGPSEEERKGIAIKWRALADALKAGPIEDGLMNRLAEVDSERNEALLRRMTARSGDLIKRMWAARGEQPRMAGNLLISPSLVKQLEAKERESPQ